MLQYRLLLIFVVMVFVKWQPSTATNADRATTDCVHTGDDHLDTKKRFLRSKESEADTGSEQDEDRAFTPEIREMLEKLLKDAEFQGIKFREFNNTGFTVDTIRKWIEAVAPEDEKYLQIVFDYGKYKLKNTL